MFTMNGMPSSPKKLVGVGITTHSGSHGRQYGVVPCGSAGPHPHRRRH
jgi:hypothetical protein